MSKNITKKKSNKKGEIYNEKSHARYCRVYNVVFKCQNAVRLFRLALGEKGHAGQMSRTSRLQRSRKLKLNERDTQNILVAPLFWPFVCIGSLHRNINGTCRNHLRITYVERISFAHHLFYVSISKPRIYEQQNKMIKKIMYLVLTTILARRSFFGKIALAISYRRVA